MTCCERPTYRATGWPLILFSSKPNLAHLWEQTHETQVSVLDSDSPLPGTTVIQQHHSKANVKWFVINQHNFYTFWMCFCLTVMQQHPFPAQEKSVILTDWSIIDADELKDALRGKAWSWTAPQGDIQQLFKDVHTTATTASSVKTMLWTKVWNPWRWDPCHDTCVGKWIAFFCGWKNLLRRTAECFARAFTPP